MSVPGGGGLDPIEASGPAVRSAAALVARAGRSGVVALTGAGISTDAGIPDFRGPQGVWTKNPGAERQSTLAAYLGDPEVRRRSWRQRLDSPVWTAEPTPGHAALVGLERLGLLEAVVTQNTDGLHLRAGSSRERVVEIHGTVHVTECWRCHDRQPTRAVLARVRAGDADPHCRRLLDDGSVCDGILKSATISFGQSLDPEVLDRAVRAAARARVLVAVGTTLEVQPAASLVPLAKSRGAAVVIVNGSPTACDHLADVVVRGSISAVLPALVPPP
ncbi:MAG TPA: Sir2 family NAD-dependent protein deacetylase [Acidimicrobiales bacterium]|nr:Sir2 family NAD-dependent protein deacetylase [Acidimicrobiales bacterium]